VQTSRAAAQNEAIVRYLVYAVRQHWLLVLGGQHLPLTRSLPFGEHTFSLRFSPNRLFGCDVGYRRVPFIDQTVAWNSVRDLSNGRREANPRAARPDPNSNAAAGIGTTDAETLYW